MIIYIVISYFALQFKNKVLLTPSCDTKCDTKQHPSKKKGLPHKLCGSLFSLQQTSPYLPASFL